MPSGSNVRAGGAYVEAYVKQDKLEPQLAQVNQKVRANVSIARSAIGSIGQGTAAAGSTAFAAMALVGRAAIGFGKGFSAPTKQAVGSTHDIVQAIDRLQPTLRGLRSPLGDVFDLFKQGGLKGALAMVSIRKALKQTLSPEGYANVTKLFDAFFGGAKKAESATKQATASEQQMLQVLKQLAAAQEKLSALSWVGRRSSKPKQSDKAHADFTQYEVKGHMRAGKWVEPQTRTRRNTPKAKPLETGAAAAASQETQLAKVNAQVAASSERSRGAIDRLGWSLMDLSNKGPKAVRSMAKLTVPIAVGGLKITGDAAKGAAGAAVSIANSFVTKSAGAAFATRGKWIARLFGDSVMAGFYSSAARASKAASVAVAADTSLVSAVKIWATRSIKRGIPGAVLGATLGAAVGGPWGAAFGAAIVTKPRAAFGLVARLARGTLGAAQASLNLLSGKKPAEALDQVDRSAKKAKTTIGQLKTAAAGAASSMGMLSRISGGLSSGWLKLTGIAGGVLTAVAKLSADSAVNAQQAAAAMGTSVAEASKLGAAAELAGTSLESVKAGVQHISDSLKAGGEGLSQYVDVGALKAAAPEKRLEMIAAALQRIKDPAARAQASMELLGSTDLLPLVNDFQGLNNKAKSLGAVLSDAETEAASQLKTSFAELAIAGRSVGLAFSATIAPAITGVARAVSQWVNQNRPLIQSLFGIIKYVVLGAGAISGMAAVGTKLAALWPAIAAGVAFLISPIGLLATGIVAMIALFPELRSYAMDAFATMIEGATGFAQPLIDGFEIIKTDFLDVFGGIIDALSGGNLMLAAEVAGDGVQLVFARAWAFIRSTFTDLKNWFLSAWDDMLAEVRIAGDEIWPGFEQGFSDVIAFLQDSWTLLVNGFLRSWDAVFGTIAKWINYLKGLFDGAFNVEAANAAIDKNFESKAAQRGQEQEDLLNKRDAARKKHTENVQTKGVRATLTDENAEAVDVRRAEAELAKAQDRESIKAAREKLNLSLERAKAERKTRDDEIKSITVTGADQAKKGSVEASHKGVEASDVRSKEGLSAIANTARGKSPLDKQLDVASKTLSEQKKQTDLTYKIWKQQQAGLIPAFPV